MRANAAAIPIAPLQALITDTGEVRATTGLARLATLPAVAFPVLERLRRRA